MTTSKKNLGLLLIAVIVAINVTACNQDPVGNMNSEGKSFETSGLATVKDQGKKVLNLESFLNPGEKWKISTGEYDREGVDAFVSINIEAVDPRVPVYQSADKCREIAIYIQGTDAASNRKCGADNFKANEIVLENMSESGLYVSAVIVGVEISGSNNSKK